MRSTLPRRSHWRRRALVGALGAASLVALAAGCSGSSGGDAATTSNPTPACSPITPHLSNIQSEVFNTSCALTSCHSNSGPMPTPTVGSPPGFDLSSTTQVLVTGSAVTAAELFNGGTVKRIAPGSKNASYIYLKVIAAPGITLSPMPNTGQTLSSCAQDAIGQWIDAGALDN